MSRQVTPAVRAVIQLAVAADEWAVTWLSAHAETLPAEPESLTAVESALAATPAGDRRQEALRVAQAELLIRLGEPARAARAAKALLRVTDSARTAARLFEVRIWAAVTVDDVALANSLADRGVARTAGSEYQARLSGLAALCRLLAADFDGARRLCGGLGAAEVVEPADPVHPIDAAHPADPAHPIDPVHSADPVDPVAAACQLFVDAVHRYVERDLERALSALDDADALVEVGGGNPALLLLSGLLRASIHDMRGDPAAGAVAESLRADAVRLGGLWRAWHAVVAGLIAYNGGRWDEVLAEVGEVAEVGGVRGPDVGGLRRPLAALGALVAVRRGDVRSAREALDGAPRATVGIAAFYEHIVQLAYAQVELAQGRADRAAAIARDVAAGVAGTAHRGNAIHGVATGLVRIAVAAGDDQLARALAAEAAASPDSSPATRAAALHCRGLADSDPTLLHIAGRAHQTAGHPLAAARAEEDAALLLAASGDLPAARAAFGTALTAYATLAATGDTTRAAAAGRARGVRPGARGPRNRPTTGWQSLTPMEHRVATRVAEGLTNAVIAAELQVSPRTIQSHVAAILRKLGAANRAQIAAEVAGRR